jgi:hypothetical protein
MNVKELRKRWWSLWSKDSHVGAACSFCAKPRAEVKYLVEGPSAYICDDCAILSIEVCVQHQNAEAREIWPRLIAAVADAMPATAPYARVEPLLVGQLALATSAAAKLRVYQQAAGRGHWEIALRALSAIDSKERTTGILMDIVAMQLNLERFEAALEGLAALPRALDEKDRAFADCHRAILAVRTNAAMGDDEIEAIVARARATGKPALVAEALEAAARHRAAQGDTDGAFTALDEALAQKATAGLLLLRGDLLAASKPEAAAVEWQKALDKAHPDGLEAERARARLAGGHPYRRTPAPTHT